MKSTDVLTFGEVMGVFITAENPKIEKEKKYLFASAGAEANVAVTVTQLGLKSKFVSKVGNDEIGKAVLNQLNNYGVDTTSIKLANLPTGLMIRNYDQINEVESVYYRKNSAGSSLSESDICEPDIVDSRWLHVTGVTMAISDSAYKTVLKATKIAFECGIPVSLDLNIRKKLWNKTEASEKIMTVLPYINYLFGGVNEYQTIWNKKSPLENILKARLSGINTCIMTNGSKPLLISTDLENFEYEPKIVKTKDSVGSGDAFVGGTISGILAGLSLKEALRQGSICGGIIAANIGDWSKKISGNLGVLNSELGLAND